MPKTMIYERSYSKCLQGIQDLWFANDNKAHFEASYLILSQMALSPQGAAKPFLEKTIAFVDEFGPYGVDGFLFSTMSAAQRFNPAGFVTAVALCNSLSYYNMIPVHQEFIIPIVDFGLVSSNFGFPESDIITELNDMTAGGLGDEFITTMGIDMMGSHDSLLVHNMRDPFRAFLFNDFFSVNVDFGNSAFLGSVFEHTPDELFYDDTIASGDGDSECKAGVRIVIKVTTSAYGALIGFGVGGAVGSGAGAGAGAAAGFTLGLAFGNSVAGDFALLACGAEKKQTETPTNNSSTSDDDGESTSDDDGESTSDDDGESTNGNDGGSTSGDDGGSSSGDGGGSSSGDDGGSSSGDDGGSSSGDDGGSSSGDGGGSSSGDGGGSSSGDGGGSSSGDGDGSSSGDGGGSSSGDGGGSTTQLSFGLCGESDGVANINDEGEYELSADQAWAMISAVAITEYWDSQVSIPDQPIPASSAGGISTSPIDETGGSYQDLGNGMFLIEHSPILAWSTNPGIVDTGDIDPAPRKKAIQYRQAYYPKRQPGLFTRRKKAKFVIHEENRRRRKLQ